MPTDHGDLPRPAEQCDELVTWPVVARAQQPTMPVVGYLPSTSLAPFESLATAFRQGLNETGFVEGQNVAVEYRYADNQDDRLPALIADLTHCDIGLYFMFQ